MANPSLLITKANGETTPFSPKKLLSSLHRSGASTQQSDAILQEIERQLYPGITTKELYRMAFTLLKSGGRHFAARYDLRRALTALGPAGFMFEKYIGRIMEHRGYKVEVGVIEQGQCVTHEIDVLARNDGEVNFMECKFHHHPGMNCNVKIPLYIHSRFNDIAARFSKQKGNEKLNLFGWVVTNTRFTHDAIAYGTCAGLQLLSWDYPKGEGLRELADKFHLYPITTLTSLTSKEKLVLMENGIILCQELLAKKDQLPHLGFRPQKISLVMNEVNQLLNGKH